MILETDSVILKVFFVLLCNIYKNNIGLYNFCKYKIYIFFKPVSVSESADAHRAVLVLELVAQLFDNNKKRFFSTKSVC